MIVNKICLNLLFWGFSVNGVVYIHVYRSLHGRCHPRTYISEYSVCYYIHEDACRCRPTWRGSWTLSSFVFINLHVIMSIHIPIYTDTITYWDTGTLIPQIAIATCYLMNTKPDQVQLPLQVHLYLHIYVNGPGVTL